MRRWFERHSVWKKHEVDGKKQKYRQREPRHSHRSATARRTSRRLTPPSLSSPTHSLCPPRYQVLDTTGLGWPGVNDAVEVSTPRKINVKGVQHARYQTMHNVTTR